MAQPDARAWWADVEDVRERIEQRRAAEPARATPVPVASVAADGPSAGAPRGGDRRTVRISGRGATAPVVRPLVVAHHRTPRGIDAVARHPDRLAGWAALLGLVLVLVATVTH